MKVNNIEQYVNTLHQLHQEIEKDPTNQKVTEKISQLLDDNSEYLARNIGIATELNSIADVIKTGSLDNPLIKKIREFVKQILPDEVQSRKETLDLLRSNGGGIRQIAEWIDLADIPVDELPLTAEEQFEILGSKLNGYFIASKLEGESLVKITEQLLQLNKELNDNEKKIVVSLAKYCAQKVVPIGEMPPARFLAENIQRLGIKEESDLIELAKLLAQHDGFGTAKNIQKFGIRNESALVKIAKLCVRPNDGGPSVFIQNFKIRDQEALIEIAKLCAQHCAFGTAKNIQKFGIKDPDTLIEIAKLLAQHDGLGTALNIQNFKIQNPKTLVEIAMLCAQNDGSMAEHIKKFSIEDESIRVELAKLCIPRDSLTTIRHFNNFDIQNQAILVELAKLCAQQNGENTAEYIDNFNIKDQEDRLKIFIDCIKQSETAMSFSEKFAPLPKLFDYLFEAFNKSTQRMEFSEAHKVELQKLRNKSSEINPYQQQIEDQWFLRCLAFMTTLDQKALGWTLESGLLNDLSALRDPKLRQKLTVGLFQLAESAEGRNRWNKDLSNLSPDKGVRLLAITLFGLEKAGISAESIDKALKKVLTQKTKNDARKIQLLLQMTQLLASTNLLKDEQKVSAFNKIFLEADTATKILDNSTASIGLIHLKETEWIESKENLKRIFNESFKKIIPLEGFKGDASQMYEKYFTNSRYPNGLITYAAGLRSLDEPGLIESLDSFVVSVFNGTFKSMRYDSTRNPHLAKIYEARPDLKEQWSKCSEIQFQNVSKGAIPREEMFDAKDWLNLNLMRFKHLGEEDLFYVGEYLTANSDETRDEVRKSLSQALSQSSQSKKKAELDQDPIIRNLKIQLACMNLAKSGKEKPLKALEKEFNAIKQHLELKGVRAQFVNDVNDILATIKKPKASIEETFQVMITDEPLDLLYVGLDVEGSCQRLDGYAPLNKGLLGYLMDGKNQVLAIKDPSGKIVARAMLRLMWDGEKPVLFRELFYPNTISEKEKEAMNQVAIQLAKALGVTITAEEGELEYEKPLHSLGGPAPWEYSDAGSGLHLNGVYTLERVKVLA